MIWPFSAFARWAEKKGIEDALTPEQKLELARQKIAVKNA